MVFKAWFPYVADGRRDMRTRPKRDECRRLCQWFDAMFAILLSCEDMFFKLVLMFFTKFMSANLYVFVPFSSTSLLYAIRHSSSSKASPTFGHANANLNHDYIFLQILILYTFYKHRKICICMTKCWAGFATVLISCMFLVLSIGMKTFLDPYFFLILFCNMLLNSSDKIDM